MDTGTRYTLGRALAGTMQVVGWIIALLVIIAVIAQGVEAKRQLPLIIIGAAVIGVAIGALNHGAWQALLALFDIADETRLQTYELQHHGELLRRRGLQPAAGAPSHPTPGEIWAPEPAHTQPPLPPVPLPNGPRPGETPEQWAKRIEQEEATAFRRRSGR